MNIDGHTRPQIVPKLLPQVYVQELYNRIVSEPEYSGIKEAIDADNKIIISDSKSGSLLQPSLKNVSTILGCVWF